MKKSLFSIKEDNILITFIEKNPQNIKYAMRLAAIQLNKTPKQCLARYYSTVRGKIKAFSLSSDVINITNVKNQRIDIIDGEIKTEKLPDFLRKRISKYPYDQLMKDNWVFIRGNREKIRTSVTHYNLLNLDKKLTSRKYQDGCIIERIK